MWIAGAVLLAILVAEAVYVLSTGLEKSATVMDEPEAPVVEALHVEGTRLVDTQGRPVVMRGISIGWHNLWPRFYNSQAVVRLHEDWGCRLFRAAIGADDLDEMLNGTTYHPGYITDPEGALQKLFAVVDGAISCGAYIIVDWHSHKLHLEEATEFFTAVAERYKGVPNVIYELYNEPVDDNWADLKAYAESLIGNDHLHRSFAPSHPDGMPALGPGDRGACRRPHHFVRQCDVHDAFLCRNAQGVAEGGYGRGPGRRPAGVHLGVRVDDGQRRRAARSRVLEGLERVGRSPRAQHRPLVVLGQGRVLLDADSRGFVRGTLAGRGHKALGADSPGLRQIVFSKSETFFSRKFHFFVRIVLTLAV